MADVVYNNLNQWKQLPLTSLKLEFIGVVDTYEWNVFEQGSEVSVKAVVKPDSYGGARTLAYKLNVKAKIAQNNIMTQQLALLAMTSSEIKNMTLEMGLNDTTAERITIYVDCNGENSNTSTKKRLSAYYEIEDWDDSPNYVINAQAILSKDIMEINNGTYFITQRW